VDARTRLLARAAARVDVQAGRRRRIEARAEDVGDHVHVHVLSELVARERLTYDVHEVIVGVRDIEAHHLHRLAEALEVLGEAEAVQLLVILVPVRTQALEDVGGVEHCGAVHGQDRFGLRHQLAVHPDFELVHRHASRT
jgi:hypothetical protein